MLVSFVSGGDSDPQLHRCGFVLEPLGINIPFPIQKIHIVKEILYLQAALFRNVLRTTLPRL